MALHSRWARAVIASFSIGVFAACGGSLATDSDDTSPSVADSGASEASTPSFDTTLQANASCLPQPLPTNADGTAACRIFFVLTSADESSCSASQGLAPAAAAMANSFSKTYPGRAVCELAELPSSDWKNGSCAGSFAAGWCYLTGASAGDSCDQGIAFSPTGAPPAGAVAVLSCP
jgi:hypothetical protein